MLETNFGGDSEPDHLTKIGDKIYFSASVYGDRELYVMDDLSSSPRLVKNINPNSSSIDSDGFFKEFNGILLFTATSNSNGNYNRQLWRSDGTTAGTYLVKIINPNYDTLIENSLILGNKMFFTSYVNGSNDLWVTDGTEIGTHIVKKINQNGNSSVMFPFVYNADIYFLANDGITGSELWKTDGTEIGTSQVLDFNTGSSSGILQKPIVFNGNIFFLGNNSSNQFGLWSLNGSQSNLVKTFSTSNYFDPIVFNNRLYFAIRIGSNIHLWSTDGTSSNTAPIFSNPPYASIIGYNNPLILMGNKLFFAAYDSSFNSSYWTSEGNASTTYGLSSYIPQLNNTTIVKTSTENKYLILRDNNNYEKHYITNGNVAGTKLFTDIKLTSNYTGYSLNALDYNNLLIVNGENTKNGIELFTYDITTNSSNLLSDMNHKYSSDINNSETLNNNLVYFGNGFKEGMEVFTSDGTLSNTKVLKDLNPGEYSTVWTGDDNDFFKNGNKLFFRCTNGNGYEPCVTDGTELGTKIIKDITTYSPGSVKEDPCFMHLNNNVVLFGADDGANNTTGATRLWRTDGTEAGTYKVHDVQIVDTGTYIGPTQYANLNGKVYFTGYDNNNLYSIWETDGTSSGTVIFKTFYNSLGQNVLPVILNTIGDKFIVIANDKTSNGKYYQDYWSSDGSSSANMLKFARYQKPTEYDSGVNFRNSVVFNNKLYFYTLIYDPTNPQNTYKLYTTDGTISGTTPFSSTLSSCCSAEIKFIKCDSKLFILKGDLYVTDGVYQPIQLTTGTQTFKDFNCINGNLFFLNSEYQNSKIWTSNGTLSGTYPFNLYANGHLISNAESIYKLVSTDDKLFYYANFYNTDELKNSGGEIFIVDLTNTNLSIEEVDKQKKSTSSYLIYPNPVEKEITIENIKKEVIKSIKVFDSAGRLLKFEHSINNTKKSIDLQDQEAGLFFISIESEYDIITKKIIKK